MLPKIMIYMVREPGRGIVLYRGRQRRTKEKEHRVRHDAPISASIKALMLGE